MASDRRIIIEFEIADKGATKVLTDLDQAADHAGATMSGKASVGASQLEASLVRATSAGVAIGETLRLMAERALSWGETIISKAAMAGARMEQLGGVATYLGERAGYSAAYIKQMSDRMQETGITGQEAISTITQFIRYGFDLNQVLQLQAAAQNSASIAGKNSSEVLGELMQGITLLEPRLLESAGYTVNLVQAEKAYTLATGQSALALDGRAKQQMLLNAVLAQAKDLEGVYGLSLSYAAKQAESSIRAWDQVYEQIGLKILPITNLAYTSWYHLAEGIRDAVKSSGSAVSDWAGTLVDWLEKAGHAAASMATFFFEHREMFVGIATAVGALVAYELAAWLMAVTVAAAAFVGPVGLLVIGIGALVGELANLTGIPLSEWYERAKLAAQGYNIVQIEVRLAAEKTQAAMEAAQKPIADLAAHLQKIADSNFEHAVAAMATSAQQLAAAAPITGEKINMMEVMLENLERTGHATSQTVFEFARTVAELGVKVETLPPALKVAVLAYEEWLKTNEAARKANQANLTSIDDVREGLKWEIANMKDLGETTKEIALAYGLSEQAVKGFEEQLKAEGAIAKANAEAEAAHNLVLLESLVNNEERKLAIIKQGWVNRAEVLRAEYDAGTLSDKEYSNKLLLSDRKYWDDTYKLHADAHKALVAEHDKFNAEIEALEAKHWKNSLTMDLQAINAKYDAEVQAHKNAGTDTAEFYVGEERKRQAELASVKRVLNESDEANRQHYVLLATLAHDAAVEAQAAFKAGDITAQRLHQLEVEDQIAQRVVNNWMNVANAATTAGQATVATGQATTTTMATTDAAVQTATAAYGVYGSTVATARAEAEKLNQPLVAIAGSTSIMNTALQGSWASLERTAADFDRINYSAAGAAASVRTLSGEMITADEAARRRAAGGSMPLEHIDVNAGNVSQLRYELDALKNQIDSFNNRQGNTIPGAGGSGAIGASDEYIWKLRAEARAAAIEAALAGYKAEASATSTSTAATTRLTAATTTLTSAQLAAASHLNAQTEASGGMPGGAGGVYVVPKGGALVLRQKMTSQMPLAPSYDLGLEPDGSPLTPDHWVQKLAASEHKPGGSTPVIPSAPRVGGLPGYPFTAPGGTAAPNRNLFDTSPITFQTGSIVIHGDVMDEGHVSTLAKRLSRQILADLDQRQRSQLSR